MEPVMEPVPLMEALKYKIRRRPIGVGKLLVKVGLEGRLMGVDPVLLRVETNLLISFTEKELTQLAGMASSGV